ncbi:30S ribosomal protein S14 [Nocardia otitidiscaviarum]|uniref:Small ribosomal subunit protein uS14 n=1 Tax=Nocardia otitidiscaviarum TaxID=1823 RepID=A0A378YAA0_9NOCA|nr:30S ribosomal protein S14 [Nocardia otitidiscaviarum]MBF6131468.1 30S ribosomal protein S14 [Nocardia otitidiscaviarum]MBF6240168.1 30S ribosomal protein S14 [Nocardia otitidiscaviarum]MBF6482614.1 30S ribosomal protein S14 [Nocardia otitidiscaviarum]MCP9622872.1 30S ribosomal protein S14 [Nocardia otitidiscaviarum]QDP77564.1 30S ribosomal protein S14 [Nocardia otitidiscaviarum]
MAKKSKIEKNERRKIVVARYAERRAELKELIRKPTTSDADRAAAQTALQKLPRDASPVRLRNRDASDGRPRGHLRKFGLSRVRVREMAHRGELPGVHKSSW